MVAKKSTTKTYDSKSLKVLKFPESIQTRPTMYISNLGILGLIHLLRESVDNSIDEALAGHASVISISVSTDPENCFIEVQDDGRGIPIDDYKKFNSLFTSTHSGGKFDNEAYSNSSGLNGVGLTITNALSDFLDITVKKSGFEWNAQYELGIEVAKLAKGNKVPKNETGTTIYFEPSFKFLRLEDLSELTYDMVHDYVERMAFLNSGLKLVLDFNGKVKQFYNKDGLKAYITHLSKKKELVNRKNFTFSGKEKNKSVDIYFNWLHALNGDPIIESFCNSIHTTNGGTHVTGFRMGLTSAIKKYIKERNLITKKDSLELSELDGEDIQDAIVTVINLKHTDPLYTAQTKQEISNKDVTKFVSQIVMDGISVEFNTDPTLAKTLCRKFIENAKIRKSGKLAKEKINRKAASSMGSTKLSDCTGKDPAERELFILEGDSASGSAKQARDIKFQAIYPLRGKILNTHDLHLNKIIQNKELSDLITILGTGIGDKFDQELLRYYKIIILTDSDVDGYHIASLLLTFFFKYYPTLITSGHLYIANPPLYVIKHSGSRYFAQDEEDKEKYIKGLKVKPSITRFKG